MSTAPGCFPKFTAKFSIMWISIVLPWRGVAGSWVEPWVPGLFLRSRGGCYIACLAAYMGRSLILGERPHALHAVATVEGLEDGK